MDIDKISIEDLKRFLQERDLLPSRKILKQNIDQYFALIEDEGINNVAQLVKVISSKKKIEDFSVRSKIPIEYLTILRREVGSFTPKPVKLKEFPGMDIDLIERLQQENVVNSSTFYNLYVSQKRDKALNELSCLCDLVRVNGIGAVAARVFYDAGFHSVSDIACADSADMLGKITKINDEKQYYKVAIREKDMQFCIDYAKMLLRYQ